MKKGNSTIIRVRRTTKKKLKLKQKNISDFVGRKIPMTLILDKIVEKPLRLDDSELRSLRKWKKNFKEI